MPLSLPSLSSDYLRWLEVCAECKADDELVEWVKENGRKHIEASCGTEQRIQAWSNRYPEEGGIHLHVEMAKEELLPERARKKTPTHSLDQVQAYVDRFQGVEFSARIRPVFFIALDRIPKEGVIADTIGISSKKDGVEMIVTGGQLLVVGGELDSVRWNMDDDKGAGGIEVSLSISWDNTVSDDYLLRAVAESEKWLDFVLMRSK